MELETDMFSRKAEENFFFDRLCSILDSTGERATPNTS